MRRRRAQRIYPSPEAFFEHTGTTYQELARIVGCSQAHISNILSGRRQGTVALLIRLANATGTPIESWVGRRQAYTERHKLGRTA